MIGELVRICDAEHTVDLGRYRIDNGAVARCFVVINPDVNHPIPNGSVTNVGGDGGRQVSIK